MRKGIQIMGKNKHTNQIDDDGLPVTDLLNKAESAGYIRCSERFVERLVAERRIPFHKVGRFVRISRRDLDAFVEAGRVDAVR
jgi:excisionase family DNA binding protein